MFTKLAGVLGLGLVLASAGAATITLDPDAFAANTDISHAFPGVTLSRVNSDDGAPGVLAVVPENPAHASTGGRVFGHVAPFPEHWVHETDPGFRFGALRFDFDQPVSAFAIDVIGNDIDDRGRVAAYDSGGTLLHAVDTGTLGSGTVAHVSIENVGAISYVLAGGWDLETVCLDNASYVPEPATALGVLLVLAARRRATR